MDEGWQLSSYDLLEAVSLGPQRRHSYLEGREIALDSATDVFLLSAVAFTADIEREKARQRVTDAMSRKAKTGHVCGGRTFGYNNITITGPNGERGHVERRINDAEAAVVRRIFEFTHGSTTGAGSCAATCHKRGRS